MCAGNRPFSRRLAGARLYVWAAAGLSSTAAHVPVRVEWDPGAPIIARRRRRRKLRLTVSIGRLSGYHMGKGV